MAIRIASIKFDTNPETEQNTTIDFFKAVDGRA